MNYFDLHCDTPYECYFKSQGFYKNRLAVSGKYGRCFKRWKQTFAVWIRDDAENPFELYRNIISYFKTKLSEKPENLTPLFAVEGGAVIEEDSDRVYELKKDGVKFLTLTWNGENRIAGGSKTDAGLTGFGKEVIEKLNRAGLACDLSHLNDKSFYAVIERAEHPLATHSNCRAVCDSRRNLTDEQLKLIAGRGGVIGLCFYPLFLGGDVFERLYENICHMLDLGLENNIAIGSDFDGADMDSRLDGVSKVPALYRALSEKGLAKPLLEKIFYQNAENFLETFDKSPLL